MTVNGKIKYFSSKNQSMLPGLKESATLVFAPIYGVFMILISLFFIWISDKSKGAAHWVTLIIGLISLWTAGKAGFNWFKARDYMAKNTFDTCDAT
jgi:hypothetical protein